MTRPSSSVEAVRFRQGRSGASRDRAVMVLRRTLQERSGSTSTSRSNPKLPPLKRRVTFFCHKQQKKGNQRKMLCFESQARTSDASAVIFHTGHPCPDEKRPASLRAALRVFFSLRQCEPAHSNGQRSTQLSGRSGASRDHATACLRRDEMVPVVAPIEAATTTTRSTSPHPPRSHGGTSPNNSARKSTNTRTRVGTKRRCGITALIAVSGKA